MSKSPKGCIYIVENLASTKHDEFLKKELETQLFKGKAEASPKEIDGELMQENSCPENPTPSKSVLNPPLATTTVDPYGPISGQLMGAMKEACKETFLGGNPRIVQGMYKCTIYSPMEYYGNVCDVLKRRRGNIVDNDYQDLTSLYIIIAELPVVESFGFYNEVMRLTSGRVTPHIEFDSWQVLEIDPFYVPETKEVNFILFNIFRKSKNMATKGS